LSDSKLLDKIKAASAVMDAETMSEEQQAQREADIAADQKFTRDIDTIFAKLASGDRNRITREQFEQELGPTCGAEVTPREITRALRFLDPTNLGFITADEFTKWMRLRTNRVTERLLVHLIVSPEDEMWALAARLFAEGPPSNGSDSQYEAVKAQLREVYGDDAVNTENKTRLRNLARGEVGEDGSPRKDTPNAADGKGKKGKKGKKDSKDTGDAEEKNGNKGSKDTGDAEEKGKKVEEKEENTEKQEKRGKRGRRGRGKWNAFDEDEDELVDPNALPDVGELCAYLFKEMDSEKDGEYIPLEALQALPAISGVKFSKAELASLHIDHILDPDRLGDCYIEAFDTWVKSDHPAAVKLMSNKGTIVKETPEEKAIREAAEGVTDRTRQRDNAISDLFDKLSGGKSDMHTDDLYKISKKPEGFEYGGRYGGLPVTQAELSRAALQLDPDETDRVSLDRFAEWMDEDAFTRAECDELFEMIDANSDKLLTHQEIKDGLQQTTSLNWLAGKAKSAFKGLEDSAISKIQLSRAKGLEDLLKRVAVDDMIDADKFYTFMKTVVGNSTQQLLLGGQGPEWFRTLNTEETAAPVDKDGRIKMTDEELKSLFMMLDENGNGVLEREDWSHVERIMNLSMSHHDVEDSMREMAKFAKTGVDQNFGISETEREVALQQVAEDAAVDALNEEDAWIVLKVKQLNPGSIVVGARIRLLLEDATKVPQMVIATVVKWTPNGNKCVILDEENQRKTKLRLDKKMEVQVLSQDFVDEYIEKMLAQWEENDQRRIRKSKLKRNNNFEKRYREKVQDDAIKEACKNDAAWMSSEHILPEVMVDQYIKLLNFRMQRSPLIPGKVLGYSELLDLHTVQFDDIGRQHLDLTDRSHFMILSAKFVDLFVDRVMKEWDQSRQQMRNETRAEAREAALSEPEAWVSGDDMDPSQLPKDTKVDIKGLGRGVILGHVNRGTAKAPQSVARVQFGGEVKEETAEMLVFSNPLNGDDAAGEKARIEEVNLNTKRYRVFSQDFVNKWVLRALKDAAQTESAKKRMEWDEEGGLIPDDDEEEDSGKKRKSLMTATELANEEITRIWSVLDVDGDDSVDRAELAGMGNITGVPFKDWEINMLMKEIDVESTNSIGIKEFKSWLHSSSVFSKQVKEQITKSVLGEATNIEREAKAHMDVKEVFADLAEVLFDKVSLTLATA
jgi:Ca2+-binding EF-hand superfamily protein